MDGVMPKEANAPVSARRWRVPRIAYFVLVVLPALIAGALIYFVVSDEFPTRTAALYVVAIDSGPWGPHLLTYDALHLHWGLDVFYPSRPVVVPAFATVVLLACCILAAWKQRRSYALEFLLLCWGAQIAWLIWGYHVTTSLVSGLVA